MKWRKLGRVYAPSGQRWWARSYAILPTAYPISPQVIRVYFASLDEDRYGRIGFVDVDAGDPTRILYETPEPVLDVGAPGTFDDCGVNPSCVLTVEEKTYLYYIGWQRCERVPYMLFVGLAVSEDHGATFRKLSRTPLLDRTPDEPFARAAPFVTRQDGRLSMWYWSCVKWSGDEGRLHYNNVIRHVTSGHPCQWTAGSVVCLAPDFDDEYSLGRPWVMRDADAHRMWYSVRSHSRSYRIGYAESTDGHRWDRKDGEVGIRSSESGWDSEMICYTSLVDVGGSRYMFYNGNRHGSTGFGCAVLES